MVGMCKVNVVDLALFLSLWRWYLMSKWKTEPSAVYARMEVHLCANWDPKPAPCPLIQNRLSHCQHGGCAGRMLWVLSLLPSLPRPCAAQQPHSLCWAVVLMGSCDGCVFPQALSLSFVHGVHRGAALCLQLTLQKFTQRGVWSTWFRLKHLKGKDRKEEGQGYYLLSACADFFCPVVLNLWQKRKCWLTFVYDFTSESHFHQLISFHINCLPQELILRVDCSEVHPLTRFWPAGCFLHNAVWNHRISEVGKDL